jgi:quercetin dioxygenase-like cupin family protein/DNA-binding XRE family transcriptional regulator
MHSMDDQTSALASAIGSRVRQERLARSWTLDRLAEAAGVSRRVVVNVEQGATNPSVGTLLRMSDALGVGLPALVEPPQGRPVTITRAGEGATLWTGESGGRGVLVAGTGPPDVLELWDWTLEAGEQHVSEAHTPGTQELVHLHAGALGLQIADESVTLRPGDAIAFPGDVEHCYANEGRKPARFTLAVLEPDVGTSTRSESRDA